jgi:hypothetical protein
LSVAPEILPELQIQVESLIFQIFDLINSSTSSLSSNLRLGLLTYFHDILLQGVLMNKPDNSNGSRGQLTAGTDTYHLLQIQSPWT